MNELLRRDAGKEFFVEIIMKEEVNPTEDNLLLFQVEENTQISPQFGSSVPVVHAPYP